MMKRQKYKRKSKSIPKMKSQLKRSRINLKTSCTMNKENRHVNIRSNKSRNKKKMEKMTSKSSINKNQLSKRPQTAMIKPNIEVKVKHTRSKSAKPKRSRRPSSMFLNSSATVSPKGCLKQKMIKNSDPVSRYKTMKDSWSNCKFLAQQKSVKEGRKLDLAGFNQWAKAMQNSSHKPVLKQVHRFINSNEAPTTNKRDDLRFLLRAKISQKDYMDRNMKLFYYGKLR